MPRSQHALWSIAAGTVTAGTAGLLLWHPSAQTGHGPAGKVRGRCPLSENPRLVLHLAVATVAAAGIVCMASQGCGRPQAVAWDMSVVAACLLLVTASVGAYDAAGMLPQTCAGTTQRAVPVLYLAMGLAAVLAGVTDAAASGRRHRHPSGGGEVEPAAVSVASDDGQPELPDLATSPPVTPPRAPSPGVPELPKLSALPELSAPPEDALPELAPDASPGGGSQEALTRELAKLSEVLKEADGLDANALGAA